MSVLIEDDRLARYTQEGQFTFEEEDLKTLGGPGSGNFGHAGRPGEVGGSDEGGASSASTSSGKALKQKHDPEKVKQALQMKAEGHTLSKIQATTGLHPSTTNYYVSKLKGKTAQVKEALSINPTKPSQPSSYYWKKNVETEKYEKTLTTYGKKSKEAAEASKAEKETNEAPPSDSYSGLYAKGENAANDASLYKSPTHESKMEGPSSFTEIAPKSLTEAAENYGYVFKQKNDGGPSKDMYAWYKDGVQVSKSVGYVVQKESAAASMHFDTGPQAPLVYSPAPEGWPIETGVVRTIGSNYPTQVASTYDAWQSKLPVGQRDAIRAYTGSSYSEINSDLRDNPKQPGFVATHIQAALKTAPAPPPPELVWRGLQGVSAGAFVSKLSVGDTFEMAGFQSTSINPNFAAGWHTNSNAPMLEIKPAKGGAYIAAISPHKSEREYLLPHNAKYTVKGLARVKMAGSSTPRTVLQVEMHPFNG